MNNTMTRIPKILGGPLMDKVAAAIGAPGGVEVGAMQRIIIDIPHNDAVRVYVQYVGDARLLDIAWSDELRGMYVRSEGQ